MTGFAESDVERAALAWLAELGYATANGLDIGPDGDAPERANYGDVLLIERVHAAIAKLNPALKAETRADAVKQVLQTQTPSIVAENRRLHRNMIEGVPVEVHRPDGSITGEYVRLIDFDDPDANDWLAVNQYTRKFAALAIVDRRGDVISFLVKLGDFGAGENLDALLFETLASKRGNFGVFNRQDLRQHFDDRYFGAERAIKRCELDANSARADDEQRSRNPRRRHGLKIRPNKPLIWLDAGQNPRARPGCNDDMLGLVDPRTANAFTSVAFAGFDGHFAGSFDRRIAPNHRDFVLLQEKTDAVVEPLRYVARAPHHCGGIVGDVVGGKPVIPGVLEIMKNLRRAEQCLGRDAAPIQTNAAQKLALDNRGFESELCRANGGYIAAGTRADNDDVEVRFGHRHYTRIRTGFSISVLNAPSNCAPRAPSTQR